MTVDGTIDRCDDEVVAQPGRDAESDPLAQARALLATASADETTTKQLIDLIAGLVARNSALQRMLSGRRFKTTEVVSSAQLKLLLKALDGATEQSETIDDLAQADVQLREAAGIDEMASQQKKRDKKKPPKRPNRRPFPEKLRRVDNVIDVPERERACPCCKRERSRIGYEITETLDVIPAELVVRKDMREKLACKFCQGELCRAPLPDKVVVNGRLGCRALASSR